MCDVNRPSANRGGGGALELVEAMSRLDEDVELEPRESERGRRVQISSM